MHCNSYDKFFEVHLIYILPAMKQRLREANSQANKRPHQAFNPGLLGSGVTWLAPVEDISETSSQAGPYVLKCLLLSI